MLLIKDFLKKRFKGFSDFEVLNAGGWSQAYRFSHDGRDLVARVSGTRENFLRDKQAYELAGEILPIPEVLLIEEYEDRYICITPFESGQHFELMPAADLEILEDAILRLFQQLYRVDLSEIYGFGELTEGKQASHKSWKDYMLDVFTDKDRPANLVHGWKDNLHKSQFEIEKAESLYNELQRLSRYLPEIQHLVHSDLLNYNVLASKTEITAVLDWGSAKIGDYLFDLAWFEFYLPWYPAFEEIGLIEKLREQMLGIDQSPHKKERLLACQTFIGLESIAYNAYLKDWDALQEAYSRTVNIIKGN